MIDPDNFKVSSDIGRICVQGEGAWAKEVYNVPHTPYEGYLALGLRVWGMRGYLALELGVWDSWGVDCFWEVPPCYLIWGGYHGEDERRERERERERESSEEGCCATRVIAKVIGVKRV